MFCLISSFNEKQLFLDDDSLYLNEKYFLFYYYIFVQCYSIH